MARCSYCGNSITFLQQGTWWRERPEFCSAEHRLAYADLQTTAIKRLMAQRLELNLNPDAPKDPAAGRPAEKLAASVACRLEPRSYKSQSGSKVSPRTIHQAPARPHLRWRAPGFSPANYLPVHFSPEIARPVQARLRVSDIAAGVRPPAMQTGSANAFGIPALFAAGAVSLPLLGLVPMSRPAHGVSPVVSIDEGQVLYPSQAAPSSSRNLREPERVGIQAPPPRSHGSRGPGDSAAGIFDTPATPLLAGLAAPLTAPELGLASIVWPREWRIVIESNRPAPVRPCDDLHAMAPYSHGAPGGSLPEVFDAPSTALLARLAPPPSAIQPRRAPVVRLREWVRAAAQNRKLDGHAEEVAWLANPAPESSRPIRFPRAIAPQRRLDHGARKPILPQPIASRAGIRSAGAGSDAVESLSGANTIYPVFSHLVEPGLEHILQAQTLQAEDLPPLTLNLLVSGPIAPPAGGGIVILLTGPLPLRRGAADEKKHRAGPFPALRSVPIRALPVSSEPIFSFIPLPLVRARDGDRPLLAAAC
jgi:hypothetical protein